MGVNKRFKTLTRPRRSRSEPLSFRRLRGNLLRPRRGFEYEDVDVLREYLFPYVKDLIQYSEMRSRNMHLIKHLTRLLTGGYPISNKQIYGIRRRLKLDAVQRRREEARDEKKEEEDEETETDEDKESTVTEDENKYEEYNPSDEEKKEFEEETGTGFDEKMDERVKNITRNVIDKLTKNYLSELRIPPELKDIHDRKQKKLEDMYKKIANTVNKMFDDIRKNINETYDKEKKIANIIKRMKKKWDEAVKKEKSPWQDNSIVMERTRLIQLGITDERIDVLMKMDNSQISSIIQQPGRNYVLQIALAAQRQQRATDQTGEMYSNALLNMRRLVLETNENMPGAYEDVAVEIHDSDATAELVIDDQLIDDISREVVEYGIGSIDEIDFSVPIYFHQFYEERDPNVRYYGGHERLQEGIYNVYFRYLYTWINTRGDDEETWQTRSLIVQVESGSIDRERLMEEITKWLLDNLNIIGFSKKTPAEEIKELILMRVEPVEDGSPVDIYMYGQKYTSVLLETLCDMSLSDSTQGQCVVKYLLSVMKGGGRYKTVNAVRIENELKEANNLSVLNGVSVIMIEKWLVYYGYAFSMYAVTAYNMKLYHKYVPNGYVRQCLVFLIANGHLCPVTDPTLRDIITKYKNIDTSLMSRIRNTEIVYNTTDYVYVDVKDVENVTLNRNKIVNGVFECKVIYTNDMLFELMGEVSKESGMLIDQLVIKDGEIESFLHPKTNQLIVFSKDFEERRQICELLYKDYPCENFVFRNQSFAKMSNELCKILVGVFEGNFDNHIDQDMLDGYHPIGLCQSNGEYIINGFELDRNLCYMNALYDNEYHFPFFSCMDEIKKFDKSVELRQTDHYYLKNFKVGWIRFTQSWVTYGFVKYCLSKLYIRRDAIKYYRRSRRLLPCDTFRPFIEYIMHTFDKKSAKKMINYYIGSTNIRYDTKEHGYLTSDPEEACVLYSLQSDYGYTCNVESPISNPELHLLRFSYGSRKKMNYSSIYIQVICNMNIIMMEKMKEVEKCGLKMIAIKTDCLYVTGSEQNKRKVVLDDKWKWQEGEWSPPKNEIVPKRVDWEITNEDWNIINKDVTINEMVSCFVQGEAGAGKSYYIIERMVRHRNKKYLVCCVTHAALNNLREKLKERMLLSGCDENDFVDFRTLSSLLHGYENDNKIISCPNVDFIVVDEVSTVQKSQLNYLSKWNGEVKFIFLGDFNQCPPVELDGLVYTYRDCRVFKEMCENRLIVMEYNETYSRNDLHTHKMARYLLDTGYLHPDLIIKKVDDKLETNVVYTNNKRRLINEKFDGYKYRRGQKIVAVYDSRKCPRLKDRGIFNSEFYYIKDVDSEYVILDGFEDAVIGVQHIQPSNAVTVYKYQGHSIDVPFNIYECDKMGLEEMYTALTRARRFEDIHLEYTSKKFESSVDRVYYMYPEQMDPYYVVNVLIGTNEMLMYLPSLDRRDINNFLKSEEIRRKFGDLNVDDCIIENDHRLYYDWNVTDMTKMIKRLNGNPYEYVRLRPNHVSIENMFPIIKKNDGRYVIKKVVNGETLIFTGNHLEEMELKQMELMNKYYLLSENEFVEFGEKFLKKLEYKIPKENKPKRKRHREENVGSIYLNPSRYIVKEYEDLLGKSTIGEYMNRRSWYIHIEDCKYDVVRTWGNNILIQWESESETMYKVQTDDTDRKRRKVIGSRFYYSVFNKSEFLNVVVHSLEKRKKMYFSEVLNRDVRLFCEFELKESITIDDTVVDDMVLDGVIKTMISLAKKNNVEIYEKDIKICRWNKDLKIRYRVSVPSEVFENIKYQKFFWCKFMEEVDSYLPYMRRDCFELDMKIYENENYVNGMCGSYYNGSLIRSVIKNISTVIENECVLDRQTVYDYMLSSDPPLMYSELSEFYETRYKKSIIPYYRDSHIRKSIKKIKLPTGFHWSNARKVHHNIIYLHRIEKGMCPMCLVEHKDTNGYLYKKKSGWGFKCLKI